MGHSYHGVSVTPSNLEPTRPPLYNTTRHTSCTIETDPLTASQQIRHGYLRHPWHHKRLVHGGHHQRGNDNDRL